MSDPLEWRVDRLEKRIRRPPPKLAPTRYLFAVGDDPPIALADAIEASEHPSSFEAMVETVVRGRAVRHVIRVVEVTRALPPGPKLLPPPFGYGVKGVA